MTWPEARDYCAAHHGRLAAIETAQDQADVNDLMMAQYQDPNYVSTSGVWLGGTALAHPATSGPHGAGPSDGGASVLADWRWYPDLDNLGPASTWTYGNWNNNEPNSGGSVTNPARELCMFIWMPPHVHWGNWNDWHCSNRESFLCEDTRSPPSLPPSPPAPPPSPPPPPAEFTCYWEQNLSPGLTETKTEYWCGNACRETDWCHSYMYDTQPGSPNNYCRLQAATRDQRSNVDSTGTRTGYNGSGSYKRTCYEDQSAH